MHSCRVTLSVSGHQIKKCLHLVNDFSESIQKHACAVIQEEKQITLKVPVLSENNPMQWSRRKDWKTYHIVHFVGKNGFLVLAYSTHFWW